MSSSTIIDDSYLPKIKQALANLDTLESELELASRAGLHLAPGGPDVAQITKDLKRARDTFQQILNVYFPGQ